MKEQFLFSWVLPATAAITALLLFVLLLSVVWDYMSAEGGSRRER
jgi:hypothetical protein